MKWQGRRQSDNVEDRRSISGGGKAIIGGGVIGIIVLLLNVFGGETGQQIAPILEQMQGGQGQQTEAAAPLSKEDEEMGNYVRTLLAYNEDTWTKIFAEHGMTYEKPKLVLFKGAVQTACGGASSASGPFYCPGDRKVYMDLDFFEELKTKFGAKGGDFAIAYVIAHEIGHHIQTLMGTSSKMRQMQQGKSDAEANKLSVALELQADFYAGVWAHDNQKDLDVGDIDEALSAANAVGDDAIQSKMQGHVVPDSFTHGTSEQRMYWFKKGFKTGDINQGNTFEEIR
ncbi:MULTISPECIES: KPN_02809 family neutral zinc metallopeptidase [Flavobacterium]|jgi:predicted metalloprotease|uniref:Neutral zinc metallopeptidase n=1 Tax=Flavobacterium chungangensis TaxID=2708132 RepID=A0ABV8Z7U2_9FLAO|nr:MULTISPECIES: neutral zinc metallopeptidase [Flavobacterium]MCM0667987.1 neutral zinc metallopeptidase [Flavobacterium tyrosinilyticum]MDY0986053.1 neutral zinc metallopeptidase [Flavobacterium sp. CFBP9031]PBI90799.1 putative neutral zinc metallopeptidase [Flavobacterium sp. ACN2]